MAAPSVSVTHRKGGSGCNGRFRFNCDQRAAHPSLILDDHELVRRGLTDLLTATDDLIIVGEAAAAADALRRIPAAAPDVALLDARLPDGSGIDVCREIRSSHENVRPRRGGHCW